MSVGAFSEAERRSNSQSNSATRRFRFVVEDTGIGIHERNHKQLFKPFSQVDSTYTRNFEGAGLGLATCKKLVDLLGGDIGMQSEIGKGSRFWFELPLQVDTDPSRMS